MIKILHTFILAAIVLLYSTSVVYADSAAAEHIEKEPEKKERKRGRPDHSLDLEYTLTSDDITSFYGAKAVLDDKLFTIGSTLSVYNTLKGEVISPGHDTLPVHLYSVSDSVMAQSQEYIAFVMVSSSSNRPFNSRDETGIMGVGGMQIWQSGSHGIMAAVYASDSKIFKYNVPIPCLYYTYKDETLSVLAGIPSIVFWKIHPKLWYNFTFFPFLNIETSLKYKPLPFMSFGPVMEFKQEKFLIAGRDDKDSKIYRQYASIAMTFQSYITMFAGVYISAGYVPYNIYYQGNKINDRSETLIDDREVFLKAGLQLFIF